MMCLCKNPHEPDLYRAQRIRPRADDSIALKTEMVQLRRAQQDSKEEVSNLRMALAQGEDERKELQLTLEAAQVDLYQLYVGLGLLWWRDGVRNQSTPYADD